MDLKLLVKELKAKREIANQEPGAHPQTHGVMLGKIRRAEEDLKQLFATYKNEVSRRIVFILPTGPGAAEFHKIATGEEFGCFSADAEGVYKETIKNINPRLYDNHPFSPDVLTTVSNYFQDVADEIGVLSYPMMTFKNRYAKTNKTQDDLLESVKQAVNEDIGTEIVGHYIIHQVTKAAIDENFAGKIVPVVVSSNDMKLIEDLAGVLRMKINKNVFPIETGEEVTVESVDKELKAVRKSMKNVV